MPPPPAPELAVAELPSTSAAGRVLEYMPLPPPSVASETPAVAVTTPAAAPPPPLPLMPRPPAVPIRCPAADRSAAPGERTPEPAFAITFAPAVSSGHSPPAAVSSAPKLVAPPLNPSLFSPKAALARTPPAPMVTATAAVTVTKPSTYWPASPPDAPCSAVAVLLFQRAAPEAPPPIASTSTTPPRASKRVDGVKVPEAKNSWKHSLPPPINSDKLVMVFSGG